MVRGSGYQLAFILILVILPLHAVMAGYEVGPGDVLNIRIWGHEDLGGAVTIGPDGTIALPPPIGVLQVKGLTTSRISEEIRSILKRYMKGDIQVIVQVTQFNSQAIYIFGEVSSPGRKSFVRPPSLIELIAMAGGLKPDADVEDIRVIPSDQGAPIERVNLSRFLETGDRSLLPDLHPGDTVFVPPKGKPQKAVIQETSAPKPQAEKRRFIIHVLGKVSRPGTYEFEEPPSLPEVISKAGGVGEDHLLRKVRVIGRDGSRIVDMERFMETGDRLLLPSLSSGDIVYIPEEEFVERFKERSVSVIGAVRSPGTFPIDGKVNLLDVIAMAGGMTREADPSRVIITREEPNFIASQVIDLNRMKSVPVIKPGDKIFVPTSSQVSRSIQTAFNIIRDILFIYSTYLIIRR
ncbi:hypothetical protein DRN32_01900 [Thermococci archaeon]|nr:MAG: hypothetical protein DRN32_01900 [Thermococci archaeon]